MDPQQSWAELWAFELKQKILVSGRVIIKIAWQKKLVSVKVISWKLKCFGKATCNDVATNATHIQDT